jgi:hypothetical protein
MDNEKIIEITSHHHFIEHRGLFMPQDQQRSESVGYGVGLTGTMYASIL